MHSLRPDEAGGRRPGEDEMRDPAGAGSGEGTGVVRGAATGDRWGARGGGGRAQRVGAAN